MENIKIYLAEDDADDRKLFKEAMSAIPIATDITEFDNGIDLMDCLFSDTTLPDAIFLDLRMPLMDGFECLMDIRSFPQFSQVKIIVFSSTYHEREIRQLKNDGANQYLQKPNTFNQLKTLLYRSLQSLCENRKKNIPIAFLILD